MICPRVRATGGSRLPFAAKMPRPKLSRLREIEGDGGRPISSPRVSAAASHRHGLQPVYARGPCRRMSVLDEGDHAVAMSNNLAARDLRGNGVLSSLGLFEKQT